MQTLKLFIYMHVDMKFEKTVYNKYQNENKLKWHNLNLTDNAGIH